MTEEVYWIPLRDAWEAVTRKADSPRLQEHLLRDALRDGQIASVASYMATGNLQTLAPPAVSRGVQPDALFWRFAEIDWRQSSGLRKEMSIEDADAQLVDLPRQEIFGINVSEQDLLDRWHIPDYFDSPTAPAAPATQKPRRKGPGGRGGDFEWEKCLIEAARWMHLEGVPSKQAELIRHMAEWFGLDGPSETQLKEHLAPLYLALKTGEPSD